MTFRKQKKEKTWKLHDKLSQWRPIRYQFFLPWRNSSSGPEPPHYRVFMITLRHTTLGRTPPDEWLAPRRDLYLTTHNNQKSQTSLPPVGFETRIPTSERPRNYALGRAATGIGRPSSNILKYGRNKCVRPALTFKGPVLRSYHAVDS
jgi:hypothetical protein